MKQLFLIIVIWFSTNLLAQETFFRFVNGWRSLHIKEQFDSYSVCGLAMNSSYYNYTYIEEVSDNADSLSSFSMPIDTAIHEFRYSNSFAENIESNYVASYYVESSTNYAKGLLIKYTNNYLDTIYTSILNLGSNESML
ncbi:MAG: hypothetical protein JXR60_12075 [Bacteroidales bacterium]|nr:hypothetical protein [Bacteroidales bacterium]